ncbi:hypothetical protein NLG97_g7549 [Lecanicillium saksenae]|uniref:Uncharacterized protein n=1 Tax=Lecanicillium saksenae TaxID=468837 RepID=A0ACC1QMM4_9HYPO|nr:hypothetical protein NLG97_g7549 [Lecanicillium saksenae]
MAPEGIIAAHGGGGLVVEVSDKHGGGLNVKDAIGAVFHLLESRGVEGSEGCLGGAINTTGLGASTSLSVAVQGDTAILGMDSTVMAEKQVATDKGTSALHAFEGTFFGIWKKSFFLFFFSLSSLSKQPRSQGGIAPRGDENGIDNWHLYLRSGARAVFRDDVDAAWGGKTATLAPGILGDASRDRSRCECVGDVGGSGGGEWCYQQCGRVVEKRHCLRGLETRYFEDLQNDG